MAKKPNKANKAASQGRVMVQCRTAVNRDAVRRESINGVEHIIVSSSTLPDDIVMNGGLYPAEEIEKSFKSLELTLAPIEHPQIDGQFISASDPRAIHDFHAGAFNMNVRRENGRVHIDKYINVAEAMKTDRGKRLLDRIDELENNEDPRPVHTSVGVFLLPEDTGEPQTNASGDEFTWIARDMLFDHDAILLDSVGAAQPHQGVGVAVNQKGDECRVDVSDIEPVCIKNPIRVNYLSQDDMKRVAITFNELAGNAEGLSFNEIEMLIHDALNEKLTFGNEDHIFVVDVFPEDSTVICEFNGDLFTVPFVISEEGQVTIVGIPLPVERNVTFTPKTNHSEGDAMKELMLKALADAGVTVNAEITDEELMAKYNELQASQSDGDGSGADNDGIAEVVANAVAAATQPLVEQIDGMKEKLNAAESTELQKLADMVANSGKYPALDAESAKLLPVDKLKEMAANCESAFGVSPVINAGKAGAESTVPADMPE